MDRRRYFYSAGTTPYRSSYARLAPSLLNTEQELDRTLALIHAMA